MLQALSSITNDGVMLKPYVVSKIVDENGAITYEGGKTVIGQVMQDTTAQKMRELMFNANYDGLSKWWQPTNVKMLAKTGTAQIASPTGGYLNGKYDNIYSVAGIFPDDNPRYIVYAAVKKIVGTQKNVANMVTKAVDEIASYANLNEQEKIEYANNIVTLENYTSKKTDEVVSNLESHNLKVVLVGNGQYVVNQFPRPNTKVVSGSKIIVVTNDGVSHMPDLTNWSLSEVKNYAKLAGFTLTYDGYGYVKSQSIEINSEVIPGSSLHVTLGEKNPVDEKLES